MTKKMTKKDFYTLIADAMADNADVVAFCEKEIAALDHKAEKAKERAAAKAAEGDALTDAILAVLTEEAMTNAEILAKLDGEGLTVNKVAYRTNKLAQDGKAVKCEVTVADDNGKNRKLVAYTAAQFKPREDVSPLFYMRTKKFESCGMRLPRARPPVPTPQTKLPLGKNCGKIYKRGVFMDYCLRSRLSPRYLAKAAEIRVDYRDRRSIPDVAHRFPDKTIILFPGDEEYDWTEIDRYNLLCKSNFIISLNNVPDALEAKRRGLRFMLNYEATSYWDLIGLQNLGCEYAYVGIPLFFDLEGTLNYDIKLRAIPTVAYNHDLPYEDGICGKWIRPEDVEEYEGYIQVLQQKNRP